MQKALPDPSEKRTIVFPRSILSMVSAAGFFFGCAMAGYFLIAFYPLFGYPALVLSMYFLGVLIYVIQTPYVRITGKRVELFTIPKYVLYEDDIVDVQLFVAEQKLVIDTKDQGEKVLRMFFMDGPKREAFLDLLVKKNIPVSEVNRGA